MPPLLRLVLDATSATLLVAALAYWAMGNLAHELVGTAMFLLVLAHNGVNRRWYGRLGRITRQPRGRVMIALNLALAAVMLALLGSSVIVSRDVFGFLPFAAGITSRDIHLLSAHWALVLVGLHVGLNWPVVAGLARQLITRRLPQVATRIAGWIAALALAALGLHSAMAMSLPAKLINLPTMDMWDFTTRTPRFFVNWLSIIGLFAVLARLSVRMLPQAGNPFFTSAPPSPDKHTT